MLGPLYVKHDNMIHLFWKIFLSSLTSRMYKRRTWWPRLQLRLGVLSICFIWNLFQSVVYYLYVKKIPPRVSTYAPSSASSTLRRRNLKTKVSLWKRIKCFPCTLCGSVHSHWSFWICVWGKLGQVDHVIIVTSSFSKSSVFKMFFIHTKQSAGVFKFYRFEGLFGKAAFSWRISVDG